MDDLIGLIAFVAIAAINLLVQANKKKKQKERLEGAEPTPERKPSAFEAFFEDLAEKLEPKQTSVPDWPEGYERPDYMQEMDNFEQEQDVIKKPVAKIIPEPAPVTPSIPIHLGTEKVAGLNAPAMVSSSVFSGSELMRLPPVSLIRSNAAGSIDFDLKDRKKLKHAIVANIIFSQPRAYDCSFDNTIAK